MSKKIISVHNHKCTTGCPHKDVCYFVNGKHFDELPPKNNVIEEAIDNMSEDFEVHYSGCDPMPSMATYASNCSGNEDERHMTMSVNEYKKFKADKSNIFKNKDFDKNVQMTVYTLKDLQKEEYKDIQKMFLIKNEETFQIACEVFMDYENFNNIHFPIEHTWAEENVSKLTTLVAEWNKIRDKENNISLDSCLENYLLNGTCVYADNYIDLRYDGSVRRCPFSDEFHKIDSENPDKMFEIKFTPNCIYKKLFGNK